MVEVVKKEEKKMSAFYTLFYWALVLPDIAVNITVSCRFARPLVSVMPKLSVVGYKPSARIYVDSCPLNMHCALRSNPCRGYEEADHH